MAVTGSLNVATFTKGPGRVYLDCGVPAADTALALTAGVPSAGVLLGYTKEGNTIGATYEQEDVTADEATAPVEQVISVENYTVAGEAYQVNDIALIERIFPTSTLQDKTTYDLFQFGGLPAPTVAGIVDGLLLVWLRKGTTDKYLRFQLYEALNQPNAELKITRTAYATLAYNFKARPISTREAGDQLAQLAFDHAT